MHLLISDYLLIVGGYSTRGTLNTVELATGNSDTIPSCLRSLNDIPVQMYGAVGTTMIGECNTKTILTQMVCPTIVGTVMQGFIGFMSICRTNKNE